PAEAATRVPRMPPARRPANVRQPRAHHCSLSVDERAPRARRARARQQFQGGKLLQLTITWQVHASPEHAFPESSTQVSPAQHVTSCVHRAPTTPQLPPPPPPQPPSWSPSPEPPSCRWQYPMVSPCLRCAGTADTP